MSTADSPPETPEPPESQNSTKPGTGIHPAVLATAVALPVALVVGIVVAAILANRSPVLDPVALSTVPAPRADGPECASVTGALPDDLGDRTRAELVDPAPVGAAAWQADGVEPVVMRCGLDRPQGFDAAAALQVVNGVQWFEVSGADEGLQSSTWFAVDRGIYVALTVPDGSGPTPLQAISDVLSSTLPAAPLDPAPVG